MYTCDLDIHGVRLRIKAKQPEKIRTLESLCRLFIASNEGETQVECIEEDDPDLLSFLAKRDIFAFHSGAYVNGNGKGVLLPGKGGSGKSTIAFCALSSGYPFVGDDVVLCRRDEELLIMLPFKSYLLLKQGGKSETYQVLDHHPRDAFCSAYADIIVFPQIVKDEESTVERITDRRDIFSSLLRTAVWVRESDLRRRQASILEQLSTLPAYNLFLGKNHKRRPQLAIELLDGI